MKNWVFTELGQRRVILHWHCVSSFSHCKHTCTPHLYSSSKSAADILVVRPSVLLLQSSPGQMQVLQELAILRGPHKLQASLHLGNLSETTLVWVYFSLTFDWQLEKPGLLFSQQRTSLWVGSLGCYFIIWFERYLKAHAPKNLVPELVGLALGSLFDTNFFVSTWFSPNSIFTKQTFPWED